MNNCNFRHYFGVCDGHGQNGREVSNFLKMRLPVLMAKGIASNPNNIPEAFRSSYVSANTELDHQAFDPSLSGSTCCTVIFNGTKILCGNAGDSRAIKVGFPESRAFLDVEALNIDHKPDLPEETERILKAGGRIDAFRDQFNGGEQIGPMRVWLKH